MKECSELPPPSTTDLQHRSDIQPVPVGPATRNPFWGEFLLKAEGWFGRIQIAFKFRR